ncbi:MAG: nitrilase-related carbon-nitrogen hydrolase [Patescibacteria group bacterium]
MKWILPFSSALLFALSFETPYLWWLALIGLIPFLIFLEKVQALNVNSKTHQQKDALLGGWLMGSIFFALVFRWVLYAFPGDWAGLSNSLTSVPLFAIAWLIISVVVGFSSALFGFFALKFPTYPIFIIPSIWVLSEYVRAWLFSLFSWGQGATLGPYWSFGNLGFTLIDTPAILWSRIIGLYGVSFLVILINCLIFRFFIKKDIKIVLLIPFLLIIFFLPKILFFITPEKKVLSVALVSTQIRLGFSGEKEFGALWHDSLESNKISPVPDIVVFPEGARLFATNDAENVFLGEIFSDKKKPGLIITSDIVSTSEGLKEQIIYRNQKGELVSIQGKSFLIPAGEYMPFVLKSFITLFKDRLTLERFTTLRTRIKSEEIEKPVVFGETQIGTLLCSGITSPLLYRSLSNDGAEILVNSASQIIFQNHPFFLLQAKTLARFQAIANARPFLQASNGGQSFSIDSNGRVINQTNSFKNQILIVSVSPSKIKTPYTRFGDWPLIVIGFFFFYFIIRSHKFL